MKEYWQLIKAFFAIKKLFKKGNIMTLDKIRTIWGMIGTFLLMLNVAWLPEWATSLFGPEATGYVFDALGAIFAVVQLLPRRTGEGQPAALKGEEVRMWKYAINPFQKAA